MNSAESTTQTEQSNDEPHETGIARRAGRIIVGAFAVEAVASIAFDILSTISTGVHIGHPITPMLIKAVEQGFSIGFSEIWIVQAITGGNDLYIMPYGVEIVVVSYTAAILTVVAIGRAINLRWI